MINAHTWSYNNRRNMVPTNLQTAREVEAYRSFTSRKNPFRINHIDIEDHTIPESIERIFSNSYNFYRILKIIYLYTLT